MANVDAQAGAARYAAKTTNRPGMCLWEVQVNGYAAPSSIGPFAGQYPTAYTGWLHATQKHTDANPPRGAAVYFGPSPTRTDANKNAGDVCISLGGGLLRCSDGAGGGKMATMTIAARAKQIARPYLGWTSDFLGHQLVNLGPVTGSSGGTSLITGAYMLAQLGKDYVGKLQAQLGVVVDYSPGPKTFAAWQAKIGTPADGKFGGNSVQALQANLGIAQDRKWGPATTLAVKHAIDSGKWAPVAVPPVVVPPVVVPPYVPLTKAEADALKAQVASLTAASVTAATQLATATAAVNAGLAKIAAAKTALA